MRKPFASRCPVCARQWPDKTPLGRAVCPRCGTTQALPFGGRDTPVCVLRANEDVPEDGKPWIETFTGRRVNPLCMQPAGICLADIAHALSMKCRWTGHTREFYSVAEHAVRVARRLLDESRNPHLALAGLHHDDAEAYLPDVAGPIKPFILASSCWFNVAGITTFRGLERRILDAVAEKLDVPGLRSPHMMQEIKDVDMILLATEARDLVWGCERWPNVMPAPLPETIEPMSPADARRAFLDLDMELRA